MYSFSSYPPYKVVLFGLPTEPDEFSYINVSAYEQDGNEETYTNPVIYIHFIRS